MAGVLEHLRGSRKQLIGSIAEINPKALELQVAKEILAEVFGVGLPEVAEMLRERYIESLERPKASYLRSRKQGEPLLKHGYNRAEDWPMEFCLAEID